MDQKHRSVAPCRIHSLTIALHQCQHRPRNGRCKHRPNGDNSGQFGRQYSHVSNCTGICIAFGKKLRMSRVFLGCSRPVLSARHSCRESRWPWREWGTIFRRTRTSTRNTAVATASRRVLVRDDVCWQRERCRGHKTSAAVACLRATRRLRGASQIGSQAQRRGRLLRLSKSDRRMQGVGGRRDGAGRCGGKSGDPGCGLAGSCHQKRLSPRKSAAYPFPVVTAIPDDLRQGIAGGQGDGGSHASGPVFVYNY